MSTEDGQNRAQTDLQAGTQDAPAAPRSTDYVEAVGRAMGILESFTTELARKQQGRLTLTDAAKLTDLSRGTARRLLLTLKTLQYVDFDGKFFWLTPKMVNVSRGFLMPLGLGDESRTILQTLSEKVNESTSVGVLNNAEIIYVDRIEVRRIYSSRIAAGTRLPASCTSIGRILLASMSESDLRHWLTAYPLQQMTPKTITDPEDFTAEIARIRAQGYAVIDEELETGIRSIAVPIISPNGRIAAALNSSTSTARNSVNDLKRLFLPELLSSAARLSQTMGW